jgi:rhodanese-related sulfurtransferase
MESTTYLITDEQGKQHGIITGDTLFIGDVGRPDLAQHVIADLTEEKLARLLFHSLRTKIMTLPDHLIVYPNHGAGSACGKMMSNETSDTLGNQKKTNYALRASMTEDEFVAELLTGLTTPPAYFPKNVLMNIQGYEPIDKVLAGGLKPLSPTSFEAAAIETQALILDTRSPEAVATGFIPNSLNIGLDGNFAMWVGELISNIKKPILLVADPGREEEAVLRLARVGYDNSIGFLNGGMEAWINAEKPVNRIQRLDANNLESLPKSEYTLLDVRKASEFNSEHAENAINIPLNGLAQRIHELPPAGRLIVHCAGGYRSMIAATLLAQFGRAAEDVRGGFAEIKKTNLPVTDYVCPTTLL